MELTLYNPFRSISRLVEPKRGLLADLFGEDLDSFLGLTDRERAFIPQVDIKENKTNYKITAELPGMEKDEVKVEVNDHILNIAGEKKEEKEEKEDNYYRVERSYGSFHRSFGLPQDIKEDKIKADFKNGVLTLTIPRSKEQKAKQIDITA
jgi:HSP20 family protein